MTRLIFIMGCFLASINSWSAGGPYDVRRIQPHLLKKVNVVKRMETMDFRIINTGETVLVHRYALTILNENGEAHATLEEDYDKLHQIRSIEGALYDANGELLRKLKPKEVSDISAVDDNNLMDDHRVKKHQFYYRTYPYTIEYEIETKYNNSLFFPPWLPQEDECFSVEQSRYTITAPENYDIRYRSFNYQKEPAVVREKNQKSMTWEVKLLPGTSRPGYAPSWMELTTMVFFAPSEFEIQDYKGNMSSWQEFGKFVYSLTKGRDQLPVTVAQKVKELTAGLSGEREKIHVLYEYLQKQTRYISIQLGLGGWQPFEAADVAKKGYGDCKALTNYMYTLLKTAGIKSYYTLVQAGPGRKIIEDFPSQQFNHVILCIPQKNDTIWLECTSQSLPAGYLSEFTGNRKALMVDENGGTLVSTPRYNIRENRMQRTIAAKLDAEGNLTMKVDARYEAMQQDDLHQMIHALSKDKVQKYLQRVFELSTYNVNNFNYTQQSTGIPGIREELDISVYGYATISGKRIFVVPNILNRTNRKWEHDTTRIADYVIEMEFHDEDNYELELPEGYILESPFQDISIKSKMGSYTSTAKLVGNKIIYTRVREQYAGRFTAKEGPEFAKFLNDIHKADRNRIVMVRKESQ
jgi:hypothetical protein